MASNVKINNSVNNFKLIEKKKLLLINKFLICVPNVYLQKKIYLNLLDFGINKKTINKGFF